MTSYGDPNSARGRAQVPGAAEDWYSYDAQQPAPVPSGVGGAAPVGRAVVPNPGYTYDEEPAYRPAGRASVPGAVTGRAVVRPVSPAGVPISPGFPVDPGTPAGPGGPSGPGGPGMPGGGRPRGRTSPAGPARKKSRRRNWIVAALAVFIMISGATVVGATWYYDEVAAPTEFGVPEATTIFFADGKTQLAKLGDVNRSIVPIAAIPTDVQHAVVSAEDRKFYDHDGIDVQGIARAAWNNVTGGETQGASTITQQYARHVADLKGISYARKIREAVIANKLEQEMSKSQIMEHYLNVIYFGRGAYGIEAASQTYFSKPTNKLSIEEAAVLAAVIKQPIPVQGGHQGYDPAFNAGDAQVRWNYVLDGMVEKGWLDAGKRSAMKYPKVNDYSEKTCAIDCGINQPTGNVINYVRDELDRMGIKDWKKGGYQITTSINPSIQAKLESVIRRSVKGSELNGQPANLMAAAVSIDPTTGRVLAYYGGENGTGTDYAGYNWENGKRVGGHSPGSSFKIYTLAAGLREGISFNTFWDAGKNRDGPFKLTNAGIDNPTCGKSCTLEVSTLKSYNIPFYWLTKQIGIAKVVDAARLAGVHWIWSSDPKKPDAFDLSSQKPEILAQEFSSHLGFGQFPITVLGHANGIATFAARGVHRDAHFVVEVKQKDPKTGQWKKINGEKLAPKQVFDPNQVDDITAVLENYPGRGPLSGGRQSARKTGTWEQKAGTSENGDAWMVGYTPQIATAVWVGNVKERLPLKYAQDTSRPKSLTRVQGGNLPAEIWKRFMDEAHKGLPEKVFPERKNTGRDDHPAATGSSPAPSLPPCPLPVTIPGVCTEPPRGGGPGGPGNGGPGGGG